MKSGKCCSSHKGWNSMCLCPKLKLKSKMITTLPPGEHLRSVKMGCFHYVPSSCSREHLQRSMRAVELPWPCMYVCHDENLPGWMCAASSGSDTVQSLQQELEATQLLAQAINWGRVPFLCMHQHTHTPLPCNVRQDDEFHLDRGIWWSLALPWLCVCDSAHWL